MKTGLDIIKEIAYKERGEKTIGYVVYAVPKDKKYIDNVFYYVVMECSSNEAKKRKTKLERLISNNWEARIVQVIFERKE